MKEMEVYFRPKVHKQYDNETFAYMPDIPIPRLDKNVLRPPHSIDLDTLDDEFPEFKKMDEKETAAFEECKSMSAQQHESINTWLSVSSLFGVPGFKSYLDPLDKMFLIPTKTESKLERHREIELASEELPKPMPVPRRTPDDLLKALEIGRKLYFAQKFRSEGKEEEAVAVEEDRYEIYKPDKEEPPKRLVVEEEEIYLDPAIFARDRYKGKRLTLDEDDEAEKD